LEKQLEANYLEQMLSYSCYGNCSAIITLVLLFLLRLLLRNSAKKFSLLFRLLQQQQNEAPFLFYTTVMAPTAGDNHSIGFKQETVNDKQATVNVPSNAHRQENQAQNRPAPCRPQRSSTSRLHLILGLFFFLLPNHTLCRVAW